MQDKRSKPKFSRFLRALLVLALFVVLIPILARWKAQQDFGSSPVRAEQFVIHTVKNPIRFGSRPGLLLEGGTLRLVEASAARSGGGSLVLDNAVFRLETGSAAAGGADSPGSGSVPIQLIMQMVRAWKVKGYDTLVISNGSVILGADGGGHADKISKLKARITFRRNDVINVDDGSFSYRGQDVGFNVEVGASLKAIAGGAVRISFDLDSPLLQGSFQGEASSSGGLELNGEMEVNSPALRNAVRWLTGDFPAGGGLKKFKARGYCSYSRGILHFKNSRNAKNATFSLDDNIAVGGLSLNFAKDRPTINGTLAAKALDLTPYFAAPSVEAAKAAMDTIAGAKSGAKPGAAAFHDSYRLAMPLISYFDADVRLSATSVRLGDFETGDVAAAITLRAGKLLADVAEVKMEGGRASGQITADMKSGLPHFGLHGRFESIDISRFADGLLGPGMMEGRAKLVVDLEGAGTTAGDMLQAISGKLRFSLPKGGAIGVDPRALLSGAANGDLQGWDSALQQTVLDAAEAEFIVQGGILNTQSMTVKAGDLEISCQSGEVDLSRKTLDLQLLLGKAGASKATGIKAKAGETPKKADEANVLHLKGPWHSPTIRLQSRSKKTDFTPLPMGLGNG